MTFFDNYPPGPITGRGGPNDDGCPCAGCEGDVLKGIPCVCDLEIDDDEIPIFHDPLCDICGCCREHCHCYDDGNDDASDEEAPAEVETGDVLEALDPDHESGTDWDTGADVAPLRQPSIRREGTNYWVTRNLADHSFGEAGVYFDEYRQADQTQPKRCPNGHSADFKPSVGTHVCQVCGMIYVGRTDQWIVPSR